MNIEYVAKELMRQKGWTQAMLAREIGIHPVTLCRLLAAPKKRQSAYDKLFNFLLQNSPTTPPPAGQEQADG